ncbi:hypothetical protein [Flavobacterium sharifuzzamanii]|uniref:hypothetical protein n=1 Tax=Flavobacterium sharifuzzamanii TaxID=2211133 RepID=UPI000DACDAFB|nr:hypothetical protein [Flavobacterium sharifuzzamanii]KAF2080978.1 hypothetical protein DMA14_12475 [Flavobacterium sharifuzzamanii]
MESQNLEDSNTVKDTSISAQLYTKSFENLNQGNEVFIKYPEFKSSTFCSLISCSFLLSYKEADLQIAGEQRLIGIATQLYKEGNPVYLVSGLDSSIEAKKKNENLNDDNHIVYISYGECISPKFLSRAADIINKQTLSLIKQESSK